MLNNPLLQVACFGATLLLWSGFVFYVGLVVGNGERAERDPHICHGHPVPGRRHQYSDHEKARSGGRSFCIWCGSERPATGTKGA